MNLNKHIIFVFLLVLLSECTFSQSPPRSTLEFSGVILDKTSGKKNAKVFVTATDLSTMKLKDSLHTQEDGSFKFVLDARKEYLLGFEKKGYITKKLLLNTTFPQEPNKEVNHFFEIIFPLTDKVASNYGGELIGKPFGKIIFFPNKKIFDYDPVYASGIKRELNKLSEEQTLKLISGLESEAEQAGNIQTEQSNSKKKKAEPKAKPARVKKDQIPLESSATKSGYIALPTLTIATRKKNEQEEFFKKEIEKRETGMKKTILEITDRKKVIYETFLRQQSMHKAGLKTRRNLMSKYDSNNPLTSFLDATELYEISLKPHPQR
jgi:hypothetical protein